MIEKEFKVPRVLSNVSGTYSDENWDIQIRPEPDRCRIYCNGKPVNNVTKVTIKMSAERLTEIYMEFAASGDKNSRTITNPSLR